MTTVILPTSVTSIGDDTFDGCTGLTTVAIPSTVTSIGNRAFGGCYALSKLSIPSSVTFIGESAFNTCISLTSIAIPSTVTSIGKYAFRNFHGLIETDANNPNYSSLDGVLYNKTQTILIQCPTSKTGNFIIPSSVTSIGDFAFNGCVELANINIPFSVVLIGVGVFHTCSQLTSITIPSSVTSLGNSAFCYCSSLNSITISSSVTSIGNKAFFLCFSLTSVSIPSSVTYIGDSAFYECRELTALSIPSSVTSIGRRAFEACFGLTTVTIPSSVISIGDGSFLWCNGLTSIIASNPIPVNITKSANVFYQVNKTTCILYVPIGSKSAYQAANQWKDFANIVEKDFTDIDAIGNTHQLSVFPNPTVGKVKLMFGQVPASGINIIVSDLSGKTIIKQLVQDKETIIDLTGNALGVYLIKTDRKEDMVQKVVLR